MFRTFTRGLVVTLATVLITLAVSGAVYALGQNTAVRSAIVGQSTGGRERAMQMPTGAGAQMTPPAGDRHEEGGLDAQTLASIARNVGLIALVTAAVVIPQKLFKLIVRRKPMRPVRS